jgi:hypothetical protein
MTLFAPRCAARALGFLLTCVTAMALASSAAAQSPAIDSVDAIHVAMVRNALAALNHANITGNYTVLRDLASPEFRQRNTAADLADAFALHRRRKLDLSPTMVVCPVWSKLPGLSAGRLELIGAFPTQPHALEFVVCYVETQEGWVLDEVAVNLREPVSSLDANTAEQPVE